MILGRTVRSMTDTLGLFVWQYRSEPWKAQAVMAACYSVWHGADGLWRRRKYMESEPSSRSRSRSAPPPPNFGCCGRESESTGLRTHRLSTTTQMGSGEKETTDTQRFKKDFEDLGKTLDTCGNYAQSSETDDHVRQEIKHSLQLLRSFCSKYMHLIDVEAARKLLHKIGHLVPDSKEAKWMINMCRESLLMLLDKFSNGTKCVDTMDFADVVFELGRFDEDFRTLNYGEMDVDTYLQILADGAKFHLPNMTPIDVSRVLSGFGKWRYLNERLCKAMELHVLDIFDKFRVRELARTVWGFSRVMYSYKNSNALPDKVMEIFEASNLNGNLGPRDVAQFVWAAGEGGWKNCTKMCDFLCKAARRLGIARFNDSELRMLMHGLWLAYHYPGADFFETFCRVFARRMHEYAPRTVSRCFFTLGHFGVQDEAVTLAVKEYFLRLSRPQIEDRFVLDVASSLCLMGGLDEHFIRWMLRMLSQFATSLDPPQRRQFYIVLLTVHLLQPHFAKHLTVPDEFEEQCYDSWVNEIESQTYTYDEIVDMYRILRSLGFIGFPGEFILGKRFRIQAVRHKRLKAWFAMDFNPGYANALKVVPGPVLWKRRVIKATGLKILSIDKSQWKMSDSDVEKREYMKLRLRQLLRIPSEQRFRREERRQRS